MSKTHKIKETRLWPCEYEIEIDGFLSDEDINEAISMAWQTTEVKRWYTFTPPSTINERIENNKEGTWSYRTGRVRKLTKEIYDDDKRIERLNETEKEFDERMNRLRKNA